MPEDSNNRPRPVGRSPRLTGTIEGQGFRPTFSEAVENQVPWGSCRRSTATLWCHAAPTRVV